MALLLFFNPKRGAAHQPLHRRGARQSYQKVIAQHRLFWQKRPALLIALTLLLGVGLSFSFSLFFWALFWSCYLLLCRLPFYLVLLAGAGAYASLLPSPQIAEGQMSALFSASSLQPHASPFQKGLLYKGTLTTKEGQIPCSIFYRGDKRYRPKADKIYVLEGNLKCRSESDYVFHAKQWTALRSTWTLAELRYQTKEAFRKLLEAKLTRRSAQFLSALSTGDVEERMLRFEFGRLGLQHILAISGFHFGILIAFCSHLFSFFLSRKMAMLFLFFAVNAYFLFIGSSAAVQRSWLTALFYLLGRWTNRSTDGLNLIGAAACTELLIDPCVALNIGFQLSFLSCFAILLLSPLCNRFLQRWLPKRNRQEIAALSLVSQHIYLLSCFCRQATALTLAVNAFLFPVLLYHFGIFPCLSLVYNLFFPFLTGLILCLTLLSLLVHFLFGPFAAPLFFLVDFFTGKLLDLVSYPPLILHRQIGWHEAPLWFVLSALFILFFWAIGKREGIEPKYWDANFLK